MSTAERIIIFDTTLRDGEQSPGASMSLPEKLRIAAALDEMGVDVIEAGFPVSSPGDFAAVQAIASLVKNATVCGLARAQQKDIEAAGAALVKARRRRIHTFIATSPLHMKYKLNMSEQGVLAAITDSVSRARSFTDDVEWSAEDSVRSEMDFLCRAVETAISAGARTINLPDTVGYSVPWEYGERIRTVRERVPNSDKAIFSVHCHNDLGLAVANSLAAIGGGARQVECTVNGLGERAGNAAMEEIVMAIRTRP
ncbi:MAG: 2-isopropylmalate synthase, partial [Alphaproteobacteria bacterium]|nr:2-isopropylmalate synthase [Alphaproteobacteria bacterium]